MKVDHETILFLPVSGRAASLNGCGCMNVAGTPAQVNGIGRAICYEIRVSAQPAARDSKGEEK